MKRAPAATAVIAACAAFASLLAAAAPPQTTALSILNRMNSAYRILQSYHATAKVKRKLAKKEFEGTLTVAAQRPNRFLLELKGDYLNTTIVSDGATLVAIRPDRKVYTKVRAPQQMIGANLIGEAEVPALGARIIAQLLAGTGREGEIGKLLSNAKLSGPQAFGSKLAYVLTFPFDSDEARLYVTSDDYQVRQLRIVRGGADVIWQEEYDTVEIDKPLASDTFTRPLPDGARLATVLPPLDRPAEVAEKPADQPGGDATGGDAAPSQSKALAVYRSAGCGRCHNGGQGPDLSHEGANRDANSIAAYIRNPRAQNPSSGMPAFGSRISDADIKTLAAYLATLK